VFSLLVAFLDLPAQSARYRTFATLAGINRNTIQMSKGYGRIRRLCVSMQGCRASGCVTPGVICWQSPLSKVALTSFRVSRNKEIQFQPWKCDVLTYVATVHLWRPTIETEWVIQAHYCTRGSVPHFMKGLHWHLDLVEAHTSPTCINLAINLT